MNTKAKRLTLGESAHYRIQVQGLLDGRRAETFSALRLTWKRDRGITTLTGWVADQAALHGLLVTIRDLGLPLLSVVYLGSAADDPG